MALSVSVVQRTLTPQIAVTNKPPLNLIITPEAQPLQTFPVSVRQKMVTVEVVTGGAASPVLAPVFVHTQSTPAAVWTIPNPFGVPCASVNVKMQGRTVLASIYDDASVVVVDFPEPRTGFAYLIRS